MIAPGHGNVDFDEIIKVLNNGNYEGPLSVEWENSNTERIYGSTKACEFTKRLNI